MSLCLISQAAFVKDVWSSWRCSFTIIDFGTGWRWVVSFTLRPLCFHGKSPRYPLDTRLRETQEPVWTMGSRTNLLPEWDLDLSAHFPFLYWARVGKEVKPWTWFKSSYIATEGQSASLSWCQAPIWDPRPNVLLSLIIFKQLRICWCEAPSLARSRECLVFAGRRQCSLSQAWQDSWAYFIAYFWDFPNLEGQVPVFISPKKRVTQLYPRALGLPN
jgi:hypothetical protein